MTYPVAYRTAAARTKSQPGFHGQDQWDVQRPATKSNPYIRAPGHQPSPRVPANDNSRIARMALNGIRVAARLHPLFKFLDLLWMLDALLNPKPVGRTYNLTGWSDVCAPLVTSTTAGTPIGAQNGCGTNNAKLIIDHANELKRPVPWFRASENSWNIGFFTENFYHACPGAFCGRLNITYNGWFRRFVSFGTNPGVQTSFGNPRDAQYKPGDWDPNKIIPLPFKVIPEQKPNPDAPEWIRRETGPAPRTYPRPWIAPGRDPFQYPPVVPTPDIVFEPRLPTVPDWWTPPATRPRPQPRPRPRPLTRPQEFPGVQPETNPRAGRNVAKRQAPGHRFKKPEKGVKEKKQRVSKSIMGVYQLGAKAMHNVTEYSDALKCAFEALPDKVQARERAKRHGRKPNLIDMSKIVYRHALEINACKAAVCMAAETFQDYAIGRGSRYHAETRKKFGVRGGYMSRLSKLPRPKVKNAPKDQSLADYVCG